jgi:hypothetical protein
MDSKLVHYTDLSGKDKYFLMINDGGTIRQQEINFHEYMDLKKAETINYEVGITKLREKYRLMNEERAEL